MPIIAVKAILVVVDMWHIYSCRAILIICIYLKDYEQLIIEKLMTELDFFNISIKPVTWQEAESILSRIRTKVFVEGQNVPIELEMDGEDVNAQHWIALDPQDEPLGTVRLLNKDAIGKAIGKIGRLAVYEEHQHKGVGAALLRRVIKDAATEGYQKLTLGSQTHAIGFYEKFGFTATGPEFDDAGIPHRQMDLDLGPFRHLSASNQNTDQTINDIPTFVEQLIALVRSSKRYLRIYSVDLPLKIYGNNELLDAISTLAIRSIESKIEIVVADIINMEAQTHPLHELAERLSSSIKIRKIDSDIKPEPADFAIADQCGWLKIIDRTQWQGFSNLNNPAKATHLHHKHTELWRHSLASPLIRHLKI